MSLITKAAEDARVCCRRSFPFDSARHAFKTYMQAVGLSQEDEVLLPAYIGWSSKEGSGVFDPIAELGVKYSFYRVSSRLQIDVEDVESKIKAHHPRILVLIHYFGFPDPDSCLLCKFAHEHGVLVVEDEAHAMLSDQVGGICGRTGDAAIYSLHKLLPLKCGGRLVLNTDDEAAFACIPTASYYPMHPFYDYDFCQIAKRRQHNARFLLQLLADSNLPMEPLHMSTPDGVVPQSLPVIVSTRSRDDLYFEMNSAGFGVVSLYHTLIQQITPEEFPESHKLSRHIMNLPVHQDINDQALIDLVHCLARALA